MNMRVDDLKGDSLHEFPLNSHAPSRSDES